MSERAKEIRRRRKRKEKSQKARKKEAISAATRNAQRASNPSI